MPQIFHGRDVEVDEIVLSILQRAPARVAILGPGGIGKTTIARVVLHHSLIENHYGEARYFVACDAADTAAAVLLSISNALGITSGGGGSLLPKILSFLRAGQHILCLDNFETPWEAQTVDMEDMLAQLTSVQTIAVLVTLRGNQRPAQTL